MPFEVIFCPRSWNKLPLLTWVDFCNQDLGPADTLCSAIPYTISSTKVHKP